MKFECEQYYRMTSLLARLACKSRPGARSCGSGRNRMLRIEPGQCPATHHSAFLMLVGSLPALTRSSKTRHTRTNQRSLPGHAFAGQNSPYLSFNGTLDHPASGMEHIDRSVESGLKVGPIPIETPGWRKLNQRCGGLPKPAQLGRSKLPGRCRSVTRRCVKHDRGRRPFGIGSSGIGQLISR